MITVAINIVCVITWFIVLTHEWHSDVLKMIALSICIFSTIISVLFTLLLVFHG